MSTNCQLCPQLIKHWYVDMKILNTSRQPLKLYYYYYCQNKLSLLGKWNCWHLVQISNRWRTNEFLHHQCEQVATSVISCQKKEALQKVSHLIWTEKNPWLNIDFCLHHKISTFLFYSMRINKRFGQTFLIHVAIAGADWAGESLQQWPQSIWRDYQAPTGNAKPNNLSGAERTLVPEGGAPKRDVKTRSAPSKRRRTTRLTSQTPRVRTTILLLSETIRGPQCFSIQSRLSEYILYQTGIRIKSTGFH